MTGCPDCLARPGARHDPGCDVQRCSVCGGQRLGCDCAGHNPDAERWSGEWPGEADCRRWGWMRDGQPDLNRWAAMHMTGRDPGVER